MNNRKRQIYDIIRDDDINSFWGKLFDGFIIGLIILNTFLIVLDTFRIPQEITVVARYIEIISVAIFTVEYLLRIWTADYVYPGTSPFRARLKYAFTLMPLIDLFAILPFYIPFFLPAGLRALRIFRVIRLFRLFKVNRYTHAFDTIANVFRKKSSQLLSSFLFVFLLIILASTLMYNVENQAQPEVFRNAFSAMWWAISTVTTVGYGDIYPLTAMGRLLASLIAVFGIALIAVPTGIITSGFMEETNTSKKQPCEKRYCPYCGNPIDRRTDSPKPR